MNIISKILGGFVLLCVTGAVEAGSTDGLNIAAVGNKSAIAFASSITQFMIDNSKETISCGSNTIHNFYASNLPKKLTSELALLSIYHKSSRIKLGKILSSYHDKIVNKGFDGVLFYELKSDYLYFYGISAVPTDPVFTSKITIEEARDQKTFNLAVCNALSELYILAEP